MSSKKLVGSIKSAIKHADPQDVKTWDCVNKIFSELFIRKYSLKNENTLLKLHSLINKITPLCLVNPKYSIETAGIQANALKSKLDAKTVIHPYPFSPVVELAHDKWLKSKTKKPFDRYLATHLTENEKKSVLRHSVRYLSSEKQKQYTVTFEHGHVKIGKKTPRDGNYMFALAPDGKTMLATKKIESKLQHTSLFHGNTVQSAGVLEIRKGKISSIRLLSGHYKPTKEHGKILRTFLKAALGRTPAAKIPIIPFHK